MTDILSTFVLGLVTTAHPCTAAPLAAAMGYILAHASKPRRSLEALIVAHTLAYALLSSILAWLLWKGQLSIDGTPDMEWTEPLMASAFVVGGIVLIVNALRGHHHTHGSMCRMATTVWGSAIVGVLLAMMFCPEAALMFFGVLVPMSAKGGASLALPWVFALSSALPMVALWVLVKRDDSRLKRLMSTSPAVNIVLGVVCFIVAAYIFLE